MLPAFADVERAHVFLACCYSFVDQPLNEQGVRDALREAGELADEEPDEPAALFFALTRRPRAHHPLLPVQRRRRRLGGAWRVLPKLLADAQARALGVVLRYTPEELTRLRLDIAARKASYQDVRAWFAERTE